MAATLAKDFRKTTTLLEFNSFENLKTNKHTQNWINYYLINIIKFYLSSPCPYKENIGLHKGDHNNIK